MRDTGRRGVIRIVERAYALDDDRRAWLAGILSASLPSLDAGFGVVGCFFDPQPSGGVDVGTPLAVGDCPFGDAEFGAFMRAAPPAIADRGYRRPTVTSTATELHGRRQLEAAPPWRERMLPLGIRDMIGTKAVEHDGLGVFVGAFLPRPARVGAAMRRRWDRLVAHIGSGLRLRTELGRRTRRKRRRSSEDVLDGAEAVLDERRRVVHAEGIAKDTRARDELRAAAERVDRARRGRRPSDADAALELWTALVAGRWSLVDHYERDGRRFLVARVNEPDVAEPRALSLRERQVLRLAALGHSNKLIAYELGVALSTVDTHLKRAMSKLGLTTRRDVWALLVAPPGAPRGDGP